MHFWNCPKKKIDWYMVQTKNTGIALYCLSLQSSDINLLSCIKVMLVIYPLSTYCHVAHYRTYTPLPQFN